MNLGVIILPEYRWPVARQLWQRAEVLGFDHAWTYDHIAWRSLKDAAWFSAIPTLTAAALATTRIRLGTLVASPHFRHPVPFAKELMALEDIAGGRLTIGIGAGGSGWDKDILGQPELSKRAKADRFEEFVTLLDQLLSQPSTTWKGTYYEAHDVRTIPACLQQPRIPFAIAASGPRGMRLAARFGSIWVTTGDRTVSEPLHAEAGARAVGAQIDQLNEICAEVGREWTTIRRMVVTGTTLESGLQSPQSFADLLGRYADVGVTDLVVHWPRASEPFAGNLDDFEKIIIGVIAQ